MASQEIQRLQPEHQKIIEKHLASIPIKLGDLARDLGIDAIKISGLGTGVSGQISKENDKYTIRVNRNEARVRQRFTIAHELAHFLLHRRIIDSSPDGIKDTVLYRSGVSERIEFEANRLAADLIMPVSLVTRKLNDDFNGMVTEASIESLASSFEVSTTAMEIRLSTIVEA